MGNVSGESREQNCKDKVTRFPSLPYARQLGLLVNTLGSQVPANKKQWQFTVIKFECQTPEIENSIYGVQ